MAHAAEAASLMRQQPKFFSTWEERRFVLLTGTAYLASLFFVIVAALVVGLRFFDIRVGIDVQRLIGEPACMPSLVYVWRPEKSGFKPAIGEYVIARMPNSGFSVGAREGDRIVKKVAAGPGDKVLIQGTELWINDKHADRLWLANSLEGKKAGDFDTRLELEDGQYFLMGTTKESFDSRYWGIVQSESIIGRALPLF